MADGIDADADGDPIVASYPVFLKAGLPAHQKLLALQWIYRAYPKELPKAAELRVKPGTGMVELDIPADTTLAYDRIKGKEWGVALANSTKAKAGGSHGLAGGFGIGGAQNRGRGGGKPGADEDGSGAGGGDDSMSWEQAEREGKVLKNLTLGGICYSPDGARYMVGVFQGGKRVPRSPLSSPWPPARLLALIAADPSNRKPDNLHLTPLDSYVHLRPQFHHIDAMAETERLKQRDAAGGAAGSAGVGGGTGTGGAGGKEGGASGSTARAIHMTIKSAGTDGDAPVMETITDRLRAVQMESWTRMRYLNEELDASWAAYAENLFLQPTAAAAAAAAEDNNPAVAAAGSAKGKEKEAAPTVSEADVSLKDKMLALHTSWNEPDMIRSIGGAAPVVVKIEIDDGDGRRDKGKGKAAADGGQNSETPTKGRPGRPKGSTSSSRGGKAKAAGS